MFSGFFSSLFGGRKTEPAPTKPTVKTPELIEDGSEVPIDTIVTVAIKEVPILPNQLGDEDKKKAFDDLKAEQPKKEEEGPAAPKTDAPKVITPVAPSDSPGPAHPSAPDTPGTPPTFQPRYLWCLDNGHGKLQAGKRSPVYKNEKGEDIQFLEYEFNRDVVERIMKGLDKIGVQYYDVVPDFNEVGSFLVERVDRANSKKSDLEKIYISVHSNAAPVANENSWGDDSISGIETWFFQNSKRGEKIASYFQNELIKKTGMKNRNLKATSSLYVLKNTSMSAVLTENGFYNNKKEVKELMKPEIRQQIAEAHVAAILEIEKNGL